MAWLEFKCEIMCFLVCFVNDFQVKRSCETTSEAVECVADERQTLVSDSGSSGSGVGRKPRAAIAAGGATAVIAAIADGGATSANTGTLVVSHRRKKWEVG